MIKAKINIIRNKFLLIGVIFLVLLFFVVFSNLQSHENDLINQIVKLELKNNAISRQVEGG